MTYLSLFYLGLSAAFAMVYAVIVGAGLVVLIYAGIGLLGELRLLYWSTRDRLDAASDEEAWGVEEDDYDEESLD